MLEKIATNCSMMACRIKIDVCAAVLPCLFLNFDFNMCQKPLGTEVFLSWEIGFMTDRALKDLADCVLITSASPQGVIASIVLENDFEANLSLTGTFL